MDSEKNGYEHSSESLAAALSDVLLYLSPGQIVVLQRAYSLDADKYRQFLRALELAKDKSIDSDIQRRQLEAARDAEQENRSRFYSKLNEYIDSYLAREKESGRKATQTALYSAAGFDHNSWNRMKTANGRGNQYDRKLKRLCVLFCLNYQQANEFLMLAGHAFDIASPQEYYLIRCLQDGRWNAAEVDEYLREKKQPPLFDSDL